MTFYLSCIEPLLLLSYKWLDGLDGKFLCGATLSASLCNANYDNDDIGYIGENGECSQVSDMQIHNTNTQIHIYKLTNRVWIKFANTPNKCHIFEKVMVRGPQIIVPESL